MNAKKKYNLFGLVEGKNEKEKGRARRASGARVPTRRIDKASFRKPFGGGRFSCFFRL